MIRESTRSCQLWVLRNDLFKSYWYHEEEQLSAEGTSNSIYRQLQQRLYGKLSSKVDIRAYIPTSTYFITGNKIRFSNKMVDTFEIQVVLKALSVVYNCLVNKAVLNGK